MGNKGISTGVFDKVEETFLTKEGCLGGEVDTVLGKESIESRMGEEEGIIGGNKR